MNHNQIDPFPSRKDLKKDDNRHYNSIIEQIKSVDLEKYDYTNVDFSPRSEIIEKQRVYFWVRVYLNSESDIKPDQDVTITYCDSGETLTTRFICFAKKGHEKESQEDVVNYNPEDDKRLLCLMIDADRINVNSDDIPFIRTLFRIGKFYQPQVMRKSDLVLKDASGIQLDYYDIEF